ncbi:MAG TPA: hypothetical protein VMT46_13785 [Anaerolineaceae bacterium]|nr:hypothetical protein [Anaerolineaceae bacterium]
MKRRFQKTVLLCALVLAALLYGFLMNGEAALNGMNTRDGIAGVMLGLFICSQPAANFLDALLFRRFLPVAGGGVFSELFWWTLNILVLVVGWNVIFIGMVRLTGR